MFTYSNATNTVQYPSSISTNVQFANINTGHVVASQTITPDIYQAIIDIAAKIASGEFQVVPVTKHDNKLTGLVDITEDKSIDYLSITRSIVGGT